MKGMYMYATTHYIFLENSRSSLIRQQIIVLSCMETKRLNRIETTTDEEIPFAKHKTKPKRIARCMIKHTGQPQTSRFANEKFNTQFLLT